MRGLELGPLGLGAALLAAGALGATPDDLQQRVQDHAAEAARDRVAAPDRFEVQSSRWPGPVRDGDGPVSLETLEVEGPNQSGQVRVRVRLIDAGGPAGEARVSVRGRRRGPALVARSTLRAGEPLTARDVTLEEDVDLTRLRLPPLRDPAQVIGRVPRRTLGTGRTLTADQLETAPVVFRGSDVDLVYLAGKLEIVVQGTALEDAAPGEQVAARNTRSGARVNGRVRDDGRVEVRRP